MWEMFAEQTVAADMIIVGIQVAEMLPEHFTAWLNRLPDLRSKCPAAMIAVLAPTLNPSDPGPERFSHLKQAAALSRMDFFTTRATEGPEVETFRAAY